ncbi:hypothetical protein [Archaeoglobus veneficus]|uniref:Uncharacterized protein n=1 Tax=Archaeoglobus veneficus (strain DSM 11195 / SNP6) TaxID=693661 RepID=F2KPC8_ARCVS|nr:hypothetical protein [Archaeoglobus veneficus]AEA47532.1 hypothetical protein Arcve_1530 [Archaeoglobus veneficus SNP6]
MKVAEGIAVILGMLVPFTFKSYSLAAYLYWITFTTAYLIYVAFTTRRWIRE